MGAVPRPRQWSALLVLVIAVVAGAILPLFPFWLDNSVVSGIFALLALSVGMAYGQAGILTLASAAFASIGAYATAILATRMGWSPYATLPLAILLPALLAYPIARSISRLAPLALSLATLMLSMVLEVAVRWGGEITGGYVGLSGVPSLVPKNSPIAMHFIVWGAVVLVLVLYCNLVDSPVGRAANTARHDPLRATADGVNVPHVLAVFFAVSAGVAGLGGWLYAHHFAYMGPDSLTTQVSIQVLLMAIIGGARNLLGPVLGATILIVIKSYLPAAETLGMVFASLLLLVLLTAPGGILGTHWRSAIRRLRLLLSVPKRAAGVSGETKP